MARHAKTAESPSYLLENHKAEQYFFTDDTVDKISNFLSQFSNPCCLCAPLVGKRIAELGQKVTVLDSDIRFKDVPGFQQYDLYRPKWIEQKFDVIFCDPPFFNVSLSQLFKAIRQLSHNDFSQSLLLCYLSRRSEDVTGSLHLFNLSSTALIPQYKTVKQVERNLIEIFSNIDVTGLKL